MDQTRRVFKHVKIINRSERKQVKRSKSEAAEGQFMHLLMHDESY